jgi:hypothetical protein
MGRSPVKIDQFQGNIEACWNSFWNLKKNRSLVKIDQFQGSMKTCWNVFRNLKKDRSPVKIGLFFNFKRGRHLWK